MWTAISGRERRVITLSLASVLAGVLYGRGLPELHAWTTRERLRRDALVDSLAGLHSALAWQVDSGGRGSSNTTASRMAVLASALGRPAAEAKLMALISAAGDDAGLDLTSFQIIAEPALQRLSTSSHASTGQRISVRTSGTGDVDALTSFLSFVDTSKFPLVVRSLNVSPQQQLATPDAPTVLSVDLVIAGLLSVAGAHVPERVR